MLTFNNFGELILYTLGFLFIILICMILVFNAKKHVGLKEYNQRHINYFVILWLSTTYVIINWNDCTRMEFFSNFDGNNIIFIFWIILILLSILKINIFGIESIDMNVTYNDKINKKENETERLKTEINPEDENIEKYETSTKNKDIELVKQKFREAMEKYPFSEYSRDKKSTSSTKEKNKENEQ